MVGPFYRRCSEEVQACVEAIQSNMAQFDQSVASSKRFLNIYNTLDNYLRLSQNVDQRVPHANLIDRLHYIPDKWRFELSRYARLRNAIVHSETTTDGSAIAEPHPEIVDRYDWLVQRILKPPGVMSCSVPVDRIFSVTPADKMFEVIRKMNEKVYTHAPVLMDGCVVGVFSENTVFSYLGHHGEAILDQAMTIAEFQDFLAIDRHASEFFRFVSRHASLAEVGDLFKKGLKERYRIGAVFVTETGNNSQRLLAMLTAWDLAATDFL